MDTIATSEKVKAFPHQAAKLSWVCPIVIFALIAFGGRIGAPLIMELLAFLLMVAGFLAGVVALFGIRAYGIRGILAPAIAGIILNSLLLFIFITNFITAFNQARAG